VTIVALVTSTLTLASFVKVTQSVFFGQLPKECEKAKEVSFGMRFAMSILALLCFLTGLFPNIVRTYLTDPAARTLFNVKAYIDGMMGEGYAQATMGTNMPEAGNRAMETVGVWNPVNWLLLLMIALLAICIVAIASKYDAVRENKTEKVAAKYSLFYGGEETEFSQVGGGDLFWGFKHNWRHYFSFMHDLHSGIVNDYSLWAVVALALAMVYALIVLL
jgi:multicomponent Na+:H+ antiporter subunit D